MKFKYLFYLVLIATPLIGYLLIKVVSNYFVDPRKITYSRFPPVINDGDRIIFEKWTLRYGKLKHGDIVAMHLPAKFFPDSENSVVKNLNEKVLIPALPRKKTYLKRVIAIPRDRVEFKSNQGVYVNNKLVPTLLVSAPLANRKFLHDINGSTFDGKLYRPYIGDYAPIVVPPNHYFVMGQNGDDSFGSNVYGFVKKSDIVSRAWLKWDPNFLLMDETTRDAVNY